MPPRPDFRFRISDFGSCAGYSGFLGTGADHYARISDFGFRISDPALTTAEGAS
jgi:hypothetical protein